MHRLLQELMLLPEMQYIKTELDGGVSTAVTGLSPIHRVQLSAALAQAMGRPLLLLCADERECERFAADMESLTGGKPLHLPGREMHLRPAASGARRVIRMVSCPFSCIARAMPAICSGVLPAP